MKNFHLPLPEETYAELKAEAQRNRIPATSMARHAIQSWLAVRQKAQRRNAIAAYAEPFLRSGQLVRVLEDWSPSFEGLFLYHPSRDKVPAALRAFIDMIRAARDVEPGRCMIEDPFAGN